MNNDEEKVSIKEYARLNNISPSTIRKLMREGLLDYVKFGRIYRISKNAVPKEPEEKYGKPMTKEEFRARLKALIRP